MKHPLIAEFRSLLINLKPTIADDYRASDEDTEPSLSVTFATNPDLGEWAYQTGDNCYTGDAYFYPIWGVVTLYPDSDCQSLAEDAFDEIANQADEFSNLE